MNTQTLSLPEDECRECGCPEWVEYCAHFDGHWLALHLSPGGDVYAVCGGEDPITYLEDDGLNVPGHSGGRSVGLYSYRHDALAAFYTAEEQLLRGEA